MNFPLLKDKEKHNVKDKIRLFRDGFLFLNLTNIKDKLNHLFLQP